MMRRRSMISASTATRFVCLEIRQRHRLDSIAKKILLSTRSSCQLRIIFATLSYFIISSLKKMKWRFRNIPKAVQKDY